MTQDVIEPTAGIAADDPGFGEEMVRRAVALVPVLRERAPSDHAAGFTSRETIAELKRAGLTRITQPRRYGGLELPLSSAARIIAAISRGDQSAGWSFAVTQGHAHHLCLFEEKAQDDVWGDTPEALIASPYNPHGTARTVPGGYEFSGRWGFSSGCDHCDWFMLGGFVDGDETKFQTFLVPRSEVEIIDDWQVMGLKASGSKSVSVKGCHVPAHRTVPFGPGTEDFAFPGLKVNSAPGLRVPYILVFNRSITMTSIGGLGGMIDLVAGYLAPKISVITGKAVTENPDSLLALGEAQATYDELMLLAVKDMDDLVAMAAAGTTPDELTTNAYRYRAQVAGVRAADAARKLFEEAGGGAVYTSKPMGRVLSDLIVARNHPATVAYRETARAIGMSLFGNHAEKRRPN